MRAVSLHLLLGALAVLVTTGPAASLELEDAHFGEALFHAYQGHYFEALERLDAEMAQHYDVDEPQLDSLYPLIEHAEFSVGDFELHYRMHQRAGRAVTAVLEANVPEPIRNEAAYRLARIHFHKGHPEEALRTLERIQGETPQTVRDDVAFLRANVLLALERPSEAVEALREIQGAEALQGFSTYNLGIALLRDERPKAAIRQLERAGRSKGGQRETLAIRDKANFVLGSLLLEASEFDSAQRALDRVRLEGPFSNRALLGAGWADASAENYERALVPWSLLAERDATDGAVQEAMLALPYAYGKLDVHGRAAVLYERAADSFGQELEKVDASIGSVRSGAFLKALVREEIRRDEDWVVRLRSLPEAPETFYLIALMASHDFQTALQNYLDLEDLRKKLVSWQHGLDAFDDLIALRRGYYQPLLPQLDQRFRALDAQMRLRLEQRKHLHRRLEQMLTAPRPELLATSDEQSIDARLTRLEAELGPEPGAAADALRERIRRVRGVVIWDVQTDYPRRLTDVHARLRALDAEVDELTVQYDRFVRTRQAAEHGYVGYTPRIETLRTQVAAALEGIDGVMTRQGHLLESVAIRELVARQGRLEVYQNQARFAFADSYDRAVEARRRTQ